MQTAICLLLVVFFLLMNAFFVIAEFALVRVRKSQIDMAVAEKRRGAEAARDVTTHINAYLSACQLGITLASLAIGWLGEPAVSAVLEAPLLAWGFPEATIYPICVAVGFFIVTTLHVVVGELIPKSFAIFATEKYALHTAGPLRVFYRVTYPIMVIFNGITNGVMRLFGHDPADEHEVYTGEEIKLLIDESTESGLIDPEQNEFVDNIFDLGDKDAEGIMTPRTDVICLDLEDTLEENWDIVRQYKYTRYPVCDGSKDRIVGFVHVLVVDAADDLLHDVAHGDDARRAAVLIHDNAHLGATLLHGLQQLSDGRALGHGRQLANLPIAHGRVLGHVHEVLGVHEADDAVLRAVAHRVARVLILAHDVPVLFQRVFQIETDDVV